MLLKNFALGINSMSKIILPNIPSAANEFNPDQWLNSIDIAKNLKKIMQNPIYHPEGDVWTHTTLAIEALFNLNSFKQLDKTEKEILFLATFFHDFGKLNKTKIENNIISSKGHSLSGNLLARNILWRANINYSIREQVCNLISNHQIPFYWPESNNHIDFIVRKVSNESNNKLLCILAKADAIGRGKNNFINETLDRIDLYQAHCQSLEDRKSVV